MFHCGSRASDIRVATDYLQKFFWKVMEPKYGIKIWSRLACAPFDHLKAAIISPR